MFCRNYIPDLAEVEGCLAQVVTKKAKDDDEESDESYPVHCLQATD